MCSLPFGLLVTNKKTTAENSRIAEKLMNNKLRGRGRKEGRKHSLGAVKGIVRSECATPQSASE
jgi:hypothetical protein